MGFWGIEVKPGEPYSHSHDTDLGKLRINQATLGHGKSKEKSTMQCIVGSKSPILLCSLIPDVSESFHLDLEFEEAVQVIFSISGERSINLSGYFVGSGRQTCGSKINSHAKDIDQSDTDISSSSGDLSASKDGGFPMCFTSRNMDAENSVENAARSDYQTLNEHKKRKISGICSHPEPAKEPCQRLDTSTQPESGDVSEKPGTKKRIKDTKPEENGSQPPLPESLTPARNQVLGEICQPGKALDPPKDDPSLPSWMSKRANSSVNPAHESYFSRLQQRIEELYSSHNVQDSTVEKMKIISKHSNTISNSNKPLAEMPIPKGGRVTGRRRTSWNYSIGLWMEELSLGKQNAKRSYLGNKVFVHYTGWIEDGEIFDSTGGGKPFGFRLGMGEVMRGWDLAMQGMYVGDKRRIRIHSSLGCDNTMNWKIPENSIVMFDIELVDVE